MPWVHTFCNFLNKYVALAKLVLSASYNPFLYNQATESDTSWGKYSVFTGGSWMELYVHIIIEKNSSENKKTRVWFFDLSKIAMKFPFGMDVIIMNIFKWIWSSDLWTYLKTKLNKQTNNKPTNKQTNQTKTKQITQKQKKRKKQQQKQKQKKNKDKQTNERTNKQINKKRPICSSKTAKHMKVALLCSIC